MKISLVQMKSQGNVTANLSEILENIEFEAQHGADMVIFPEYSMYLNDCFGVGYVDVAEDLTGDFVSSIRESAMRHNIWVVFGMLERAENDSTRYFNTAVIIDVYGNIVGAYRKIQLADNFGSRESDFVIAGPKEDLIAFDALGIRFGVLICHDLRYPELTRKLALSKEIGCLLLPTAWVKGPMKETHLHTLLRARAIENVCYALGCDQAWPNAAGGSLAVDPNGVILGSLDGGTGVLRCEILLERISSVREKNPVLKLARS